MKTKYFSLLEQEGIMRILQEPEIISYNFFRNRVKDMNFRLTNEQRVPSLEDQIDLGIVILKDRYFDNSVHCGHNVITVSKR